MKPFAYFLFLLIVQSSCSDKVNTEKEFKANEEELAMLRQSELINQEILRRTIEHADDKIDSGLLYWGTDSLHSFLLDALSVEPRLFFCFSINTCPPCVEQAIGLLKQTFSEGLEHESIVFAGDYPSRLRDSVYGKKMLSGINLPLEEIEAPFFFVLNDKKEINLLHIFNKTDSELTRIYLKGVKKKYFRKGVNKI